METLYPPIKANETYQIAVDEPHILYAEESGNPEGIPVIVCHGGPGLGCPPSYRSFFDPNQYRIILFDQRGAGQSTPHTCLKNNDTEHLIADMEVIREKLGIDKWVVFGGSWGSTLSLAYAQTHPDKTLGLIIRGIFLGTQKELDWMYAGKGLAKIYPDYHQEFLSHIPDNERGNIIDAYYKRLTTEDEITRMGAAKAWANWEGRCATLKVDDAFMDDFTSPHTALSIATIEAHFFLNDAFLKRNTLLKDVDKIKHLPGIIVHGRYDMLCTLDNAWALHKAWPKSQLHIIREAGHAASEPGITDALVRATRELAKTLR